MEEKEKRMTIAFPADLKEELEKMSKETYMSQSRLVILATQALLGNYKIEGPSVFRYLIQDSRENK